MNKETKEFLTKSLQQHFGDDNIPTKSEHIWKDSASVLQAALVCEDLLIAMNMVEEEKEEK
ncbi:hypothetical protein VPIG_00108 [Vibrio phage PWH3a-P1]|uniref:hypothetical protein n=1 Tax=Vibrio phage PWH3a-P1 TaxID=754058 RepID=UPI0002C0B500|nr:hypothetical protein VPIG_00108 [Vibrio phage PWH3a-P1]AGH31965.1 hypothetical protein VPIG_00108 [Vibrio phage PWH3a-P1]